MPLVFIHGVNTRKDDTYTSEVQTRDALFRRYALSGIVPDPSTVQILNPYWGDHAARMAYKNASLPGGKYEAFGSKDDKLAQIVLEVAPSVTITDSNLALAEIASQTSLVQAVDCLWAAVGLSKEEYDEALELVVLAHLALQYAEENPNPAWITQVRSNEEFVDKLLTETKLYAKAGGTIPEQTEVDEHFGAAEVWDFLKETASRLGGAVSRLAVGGLVKTFRPWAHERVARFMGDVFVYLNTRGTPENPGPIIRIISEALWTAQTNRQDNDPFIIVAHSMGGNITYDILTRFHPELKPDLLVTVGSQVGMFEELKLFMASDPAIPSQPGELAPKPENIRRWLNVFDQTDILGYATSKIFNETVDYEFNTGATLLSAHSMYFFRPTFHQRLHQRILQNLS